MAEEQVLKIPAELARMDEVLAFTSSLIDAYGPSPQARMQLRMAMEELYMNIARYAYPSGDGWAEIRGSVEDGVRRLRSSMSARLLTPWQSRTPIPRSPAKNAKSAG